MASPNVTPFIPPLNTPEAMTPGAPVIPPGSPSIWSQLPQGPGTYPPYLGTPYSTPFFPPGMLPQTPATAPGPSLNPNMAYGGTPAAPPGAGLSVDYSGYPQFTPYGASAGLPSPWAAAQSVQPHTPYVPTPYGFPGYPQQQQQQMPGGYPPSGPAGWPGVGMMPPPMTAPPMGPPPGWGGAPMGAGAFNSPAGPTNGAPLGWPGPLPNAPAAQPPPRAAPGPGLVRATEHNADTVDHFSAGEHYGPVLEPFLIRAVKATVYLNPLLTPPPDDGPRPFLKWNMLFTSNYCQRSTDPAHKSWSSGRNDPATFPRVSSLRIISQAFPWSVTVTAHNKNIGITCGEVIDALSDNLQKMSSKAEFEALSDAMKRTISIAYRHNRSTAHDVPGGRLGDGFRRLDWLGQDSMFAGVLVNDDLVKDLCGDVLPCTFELRCIHRYPLTAAEIRDQNALKAAAARENRRRRHRPTVESVHDSDDSAGEGESGGEGGH